MEDDKLTTNKLQKSNRKGRATPRRKYVPFSSDMLDQTEAEIQRTGISQFSFFKESNHETNLNASKIDRWRRLRVKRICEDDFQEFLRLWGSLPNGTPRAEITPEILETLLFEKKRSGVGALKLLNDANDKPDGLNSTLVQAWLIGGVATTRQDYLDYILERWTALPDNPKIKITPHIRNEMRDEAERTGKGPAALMRGLRPSQIDGLGSATVSHWLSGTVKSTHKDKLKFVLDRWRSLPDLDDVWFDTTERQREALHSELQRTGISPTKLLCGRSDVPRKLNASTISTIIYRQTTRMRVLHYDYAMGLLKALPDKSVVRSDHRGENTATKRVKSDRIELTDVARSALLHERERTGVTEKELTDWIAAEGNSCGASPSMINQWINGYARTARQTFLR